MHSRFIDHRTKTAAHILGLPLAVCCSLCFALQEFGRDSVYSDWRKTPERQDSRSVPKRASSAAVPKRVVNTPLPVQPEVPLASQNWIRELDELRDASAARSQREKAQIGSAALVAGTVTVGYVAWLLRGGLLLASLLSSLPAWRTIDPLPILSKRAKRQDEDEADDPKDPLERLFQRRRKSSRPEVRQAR